ncbi:MAG TPA: hypothetical protein VGE29_12300 [Prosthecobacter sp.]
MVPGVVSLRCPACARAFLSLPQQPGGLVACPHCACSASLEQFAPAGASLPQAAALPIQRRAPATHETGPPAAAPDAVWNALSEDPFFAHPPGGAGPSTPAAAAPPHSQSAGHGHARPMPAAVPAAFRPFRGAPPPSAAAGAAWRPPRRKRRIAVTLAGLALAAVGGTFTWLQMQPPVLAVTRDETSPAPASQEPGLSSPPAPGLKTSAKPEIRRAEQAGPASPEALKSSVPTPTSAAEPAAAATSATPPVPAPLPEMPEVHLEPAPAVPASATVDLNAASQAAPAVADLVFKNRCQPPGSGVPIHRAEEQQAAMAAFFTRHPDFKAGSIQPPVLPVLTLPGQEMVAVVRLGGQEKRQNLLGLFCLYQQPQGPASGGPPSSRAAAPAPPEEKTPSKAGTSQSKTGSKGKASGKSSKTARKSGSGSQTPTDAEAKEAIPATAAALEAAGRFALHWPLLEETLEKRLEEFQASQSAEPTWFHVMVRRSHGLDLPPALRTGHLCLEIQGSADESALCLAVAPLETPLARFLEREAAWGQAYLTRLLLQHRPQASAAGGKGTALFILDCEGAVTGAVFPSGSRPAGKP